MRPLLLLLALAASLSAQSLPRSERAVLVLVDGLRWQEVFCGADPELLTQAALKVKDEKPWKARYWRESAAERRALLLPFLWRTVAAQGQLLGNQHEQSVVKVSNGLNFSYPGYSEMLVGHHDRRIDSNDKKPNPNPTVLEWLHGQSGFTGQVAVFGMWDVVPAIVHRERSGLFVNAATEPMHLAEAAAECALLNRLKQDLPERWPGATYDALTFESMLLYLRHRQPRVLYLTFGETDEFGHEGDYRQYLLAAERTDRMLARLWELLQSLPAYAGKTTLLIAADHGRGPAPEEWKNHGRDVRGSESIWIAALGPSIPARGERKQHPTIYQAQIAAAFAAVLGFDFAASNPKIKPALAW